MRFLLNPSKSALNRANQANQANKAPPSHLAGIIVGNAGSEDNAARIFGQQCSPRCGCVVRFEATFGSESNKKIASMTYDAKTIVTTNRVSSQDGSVSLRPVYTTSQHKPMMKDCKCQTIHKLASTIVETLPKMTLEQAQNQVEFRGVRSSPSFRYSVLKNHNLLQKSNVNTKKNCFEKQIINVKGGHCFDLVEDAVVACLNGYMPQPRRTIYKRNVQFEKPNQLMDEFDRKSLISETGLDPFRFVNAAKKRTAKLLNLSSGFPKLQRNKSSTEMPQFHLMGNDEASSGTLRELISELEVLKREEASEDNMLDDWLSYLDEVEEYEARN